MSNQPFFLQWDCPACTKENLVHLTTLRLKYRIMYKCTACETIVGWRTVKRYQVPYWACCGNPVMDNGYVCCGQFVEREKPMINNADK